MNGEHLTEYAGLAIVDFLSEGAEEEHLHEASRRARRDGAQAPTSTPHRERMEKAMTAPASVAWRLHLHEGPDAFPDYMNRFVREVDTSRVTALVIGSWGCGTAPTFPRTWSGTPSSNTPAPFRR